MREKSKKEGRRREGRGRKRSEKERGGEREKKRRKRKKEGKKRKFGGFLSVYILSLYLHNKPDIGTKKH